MLLKPDNRRFTVIFFLWCILNYNLKAFHAPINKITPVIITKLYYGHMVFNMVSRSKRYS